ncbi:MAG TPA: hypothetical protein VG796_18340 [Verrucomicrobiales bacterium]|nr:hypothetical protein [Verrucomicrobiales bacterium]
MKKTHLIIAVATLTGIAMLMAPAFAAEEAATPSIKNVMKAGFKGDDSLVKKATKGKLTKEEMARLAEYCAALAKDKPAAGDESSWKEKTAALTKAMAELQSGAAGAAKSFESAVNCKACHDVHRKKK